MREPKNWVFGGLPEFQGHLGSSAKVTTVEMLTPLAITVTSYNLTNQA